MVLGIPNRTENWKTARSLSDLFGTCALPLAIRLGEPLDTEAGNVSLELYWKGMRDYCKHAGRKLCAESAARLYGRLFPQLRELVGRHSGFRDLKDDNYEVSTEIQRGKLVDNLFNTEIDVVMETPKRLYIGEAKYKSGFHASSKLVLVHQLIRQFVMAKILVAMIGVDKEVVPFVIGGDRKQHQVGFMIARQWMKEDHVLLWSEVDEIVCSLK